ncbi:hypothetical protein [Proteus hauseri]|uniref:hypothetical protein n=1 Tax=Proteus hauseri TaxID=183417 RepID=UPI00100977EE|nr:hypothetical protein [Proteus hauseri]QAV24383.1 hypothetical protein PH4a_13985 [Proteus hauseri]
MKLFKIIASFSLMSVLISTSGCTTIEKKYPVSTDISSEQTTNKALSTKWGESIQSEVQKVDAIRLSQQPYEIAAIHYQSGKSSNNSQKIKWANLDPINLSILAEDKKIIPLYQIKNNQYTLYGKENERYIIYLNNINKQKSYEVVVTVDGLDVISGKSASYQNRGYLLRPGDDLFIEGFRKNEQQVAVFRFGLADEGYVNFNTEGDKKNIGIIYVSVFEVKESTTEEIQKCIYSQKRFLDDNSYAPEPCIP